MRTSTWNGVSRENSVLPGEYGAPSEKGVPGMNKNGVPGENEARTIC